MADLESLKKYLQFKIDHLIETELISIALNYVFGRGVKVEQDTS